MGCIFVCFSCNGLQPVYIVVMGLFVRFWVIVSIFIAFCPLCAEYRCNIGILQSLRKSTPPILKRGNLGCRFAIFLNF